MFSCTQDATAKLWDATSFAHLSTLRPGTNVRYAALSNGYILLACSNRKVYAYRNSNGYPLDFNIRVCEMDFLSIAFLNQDIVAVFGADHVLCFLSLSAKAVMSKMKVGANVTTIAVLGAGWLALGGGSGYCAIIEPPKSVGVIARKRPRPPTPCFQLNRSFCSCLQPKPLGQFMKYTDELAEHFGRSSVGYELLMDADEYERKRLPNVLMKGLANVTDVESTTLIETRDEKVSTSSFQVGGADLACN